MKITSSIFSLILMIAFTGCVSIPFNSPPKPSGEFNTATESLELTDLKRLEWFTDNPDDLRRIMIQIWYPTDENQGEKN